MRHLFSSLLVCVCFFFLTACSSDDISATYGTWCEAELQPNTGDPKIFTISENSLALLGVIETGVIFEKVGNQINVISASNKNTIIAISDIKNDSLLIEFQGSRKRYNKITPEEANKILNEPSSQKSKPFPDPF